MNERDDRTWFDDPRNGRKVFWGLAAVCAALVVWDALHHNHVVYAWEGWLGFHGWFGFVACVFLVLAAKELRRLIKRDEDYYDR